MNPQCQICGEYLSAAETLSLDVGGGERCRGCMFKLPVSAAPTPMLVVQSLRSSEMMGMIADMRRAVVALGEDDTLVLLRQAAERLRAAIEHLPAVPRVPWWQWAVELASVLTPDDTMERTRRLEVD